MGNTCPSDTSFALSLSYSTKSTTKYFSDLRHTSALSHLLFLLGLLELTAGLLAPWLQPHSSLKICTETHARHVRGIGSVALHNLWAYCPPLVPHGTTHVV